MSWRDRDYNRGGEAMNEFLMNPGSILMMSLLVFRSSTLSIRLHFWLLLHLFITLIMDLRLPSGFQVFLIDTGLLLAVILWHELGHRVVARMVGGDHREWVLWPAGGMVPPYTSNRPWPMFWANAGGNIFTLALAAATFTTVWLLTKGAIDFTNLLGFLYNLFSFKTPTFMLGDGTTAGIVAYCLLKMFIISTSIFLINLIPTYWFDGGNMWQAALTPKLGTYRAISVTCICGMALSAVYIAFSIWPAFNLFNIIVWVLIFASCYQRRKLLIAAGPGVIEEEYASGSYEYTNHGDEHRAKKKKRGGWWVKNARKKAMQDQAEQEKIDRILEKVKNHGLHSLTWWEKRTLRKATERQRQRDLVNK